jgi:CrcB protein
MTNYLAVALGGAIGSMGRYWLTVALVRYPPHWLPLGTVSVNVIGSFIIGLLWVYLQQRSESEFIRLFVAVGILGGFTTFSTFSLETVYFLSAGEWWRALINIVMNVMTCLLAATAGMGLGRWLF